ncbi:MAG: hypothetical protein A2902_03945 [Elusimicrobia bacterium RIFCSPLOWO2_01_FULL_64_13]|nr:MAG: hypothetical protein A2902_03945 [Elusimicrobia bacterium RIFCSPLOWO2_01_FULL_64_13]
MTSALALAFSLLLAAWPARAGENTLYLYRDGDDFYFQGEGRANPAFTDSTRRRSLSQAAAVLDAKARMAVYVYGMGTVHGEKLQEAYKTDKRIRAYVSAFLKGTLVTELEWDDEDNCVVVLKISRKDLFRKNAEKGKKK